MMASRYDALTTLLGERADATIELSFDELDRLVGGLPASAKRYGAWWANTRAVHPHAKFWLDADRRATVNFVRESVAFVLDDELASRRACDAAQSVARARGEGRQAAAISFDWVDAGAVTLDDDGVLSLPTVPASPGAYRIRWTVRGRSGGRTYVGESADLSRQMALYRSPNPAQSTDARIQACLTEALSDGGRATISTCLAATCDDTEFDLASQHMRSLVKSLATHLAVDGGGSIQNL